MIRRLLVTVGLGALPLVVGRIPLPGLEPFGLPGAPLVIGSLGLVAVLGAFVLVELAAVIVPPWRALRFGAGRGKLDSIARWLALVVCVLQAWAFVNTLEPWATSPGFGFRVGTVVLLTSVTFGLVGAGHLITRFGLVNGYAVLIAVGVIDATVLPLSGYFHIDPESAARTTASMLAVVAITVFILKRPLRSMTGLRFPTSGVAPVVEAASFSASVLLWLSPRGEFLHGVVHIGTLLVLFVVYTLLFHLPRNVAAVRGPDEHFGSTLFRAAGVPHSWVYSR